MELNFEVVREFGVCRGGVMEIREIKETYEMNGMIYYPTNLFLRIARSLLEGHTATRIRTFVQEIVRYTIAHLLIVRRQDVKLGRR